MIRDIDFNIAFHLRIYVLGDLPLGILVLTSRLKQTTVSGSGAAVEGHDYNPNLARPAHKWNETFLITSLFCFLPE